MELLVQRRLVMAEQPYQNKEMPHSDGGMKQCPVCLKRYHPSREQHIVLEKPAITTKCIVTPPRTYPQS
jgi:hypothetical protein